jgi:hypothetical protein
MINDGSDGSLRANQQSIRISASYFISMLQSRDEIKPFSATALESASQRAVETRPLVPARAVRFHVSDAHISPRMSPLFLSA